MTLTESFRAAVETKDLAVIASTLDIGVEFNSPVMVKPYRGKDQVTALLQVLLQTFEDFHYTDELVGETDGTPVEVLVFEACVMGKAIQGVDLVTFDDGLVTSLTVMVRPLPAAMILARAVGQRM